MKLSELNDSSNFEFIKKNIEHDKLCFIYALALFGEVVYIGKTMSMKGRIHSHANNSNIVFNEVYYFECDPKIAEEIEANIIKIARPKHNKHHNNNNPYGEKIHKTRPEKRYFDRTKLKKFIKESGLNQSSLAKKVGVSRQAISMFLIEQSCSYILLDKICQSLGISEKDVLE